MRTQKISFIITIFTTIKIIKINGKNEKPLTKNTKGGNAYDTTKLDQKFPKTGGSRPALFSPAAANPDDPCGRDRKIAFI